MGPLSATEAEFVPAPAAAPSTPDSAEPARTGPPAADLAAARAAFRCARLAFRSARSASRFSSPSRSSLSSSSSFCAFSSFFSKPLSGPFRISAQA